MQNLTQKTLTYLLMIMTAICCFGLTITANASAANKYEKLFYFTDTASARASLTKNIDKIDVLAPQVYGINKTLIPHGTLAEDIRTMAKSHQVKIMPLITNDGFRQDLIHNLLASSSAQTRVIQFMVNEAKNNGYYGWQYDIEHIRYSDRDQFSAFIEKTSQVFKQNGIVLSVAVVVKVDESTTTDWYKNWAGAFDYSRIAKVADFISIMTYDDPDSKGPSASIPFVTKTLGSIIATGVAPEKISLGIPAYYWSWTTSPEAHRIRSGSYSRLQSIRARANYTEGFDDALKVPWLSFAEQGTKYIVWFENQKSFQFKTALVDKYKLRGFSVWVLGMEDPGIWE